MHAIPYELPKPKNEADFEVMCAVIYGAVFGDRLAKANGGKGQAQRGVDVYVRPKDGGTVGIQCKKYTRTKLTWADVLDEVKKADEGKQPITMLLVATTSDSNAELQQNVMALSDERRAAGKFDVSVEFWEDIQCRIDSLPILQQRYAPHAPGGVYQRQGHEIAAVREIASETRDMVSNMTLFAEARLDSADRIVSGRLDHANSLIKAGRFREALESLDSIGSDLGPFDQHQKARWHLQRGVCLWLSKDDVAEASRLFAKAYELYPGDERMAAARIRGLMLSGDCQAAADAGREEQERFPISGPVWVATANARIMLSECVSIEDAPSAVRGEADILLFASHAARHAGNLDLALELGEKAANHEDAGFFTRESFIGLAVENCAANPVAAQFGLVPKERIERLARAAGLFEPREERLFNIQSDQAAVATAHLGFALMILGKKQDALSLVDLSRSRGVSHPAFARIEIQALEETGREKEALARASSKVDELEVDSLAAAAEIAAKLGDGGFLSAASKSAAERFPENSDLAEHLRALEWGATAKREGKDRAATLVLAAGEIGKWGLALLCAAARILRWADRTIEAESAENIAVSRLSGGSSPGDTLLVAETLFLAKRWDDAATLYEALLAGTESSASDLHARLMACHMETRNTGKARTLLKALPDGWAENEELRRCAMELGQRVGDWNLLRPLAERQLEAEPEEASSWLFRLMVLARAASPAVFQDELGKTPDRLRGRVKTLAQLGSLEMRYGEGEKGLRRLYRLLRENMDEPESYAAFLINFMIGKLPEIDPAPQTVGAGCYVTVKDADGRVETFGIDPEGMGDLPKRGGYHPAGSEEALALIGANVGEEIDMRLLSGGVTRVRVVSVGSVFHRLALEARERAGTIAGLPYVRAFKLENSGDVEADLAKIHKEILRSNESRDSVVDFYAKGHLTLSLLSDAIGRSIVEACLGWPEQWPTLFTGTGLAEEREAAFALLSSKQKPVVADASALAELARFGLGDVLGALGTVFAAPRTLEIVNGFREEALSDTSFGSAFDADGRLGFAEATEEHKESRRRFADNLAEALEKHCRVEPAYGNAGESEEQQSLAGLLSKEEVEAILLAKAHGAVLLTLDGRLRALAKQYYDVDGAWPQVAVMVATAVGSVSGAKAAEFSIGEFLSNRHFVSLRPDDLLWMIGQGDAWLQAGMRRLKTYLSSSDTEVGSAVALSREFLRGVASMDTQLGAWGEMVGHVTEAVLRRKDCPADWVEGLLGFTDELLLSAVGETHGFDLLDRQPAELFQRKSAFLRCKVAEGKKRAGLPESNDAIRLRVLHCGLRPALVVEPLAP